MDKQYTDFLFEYSVHVPERVFSGLAHELRDIALRDHDSGCLYAALCLATLSREDRYRVIEALAAVERDA